MNARLIVAACLAVALTIPTTAIASHTGQYGLNAIEHDDQGRGAEPDNAATSVLGPLVVNKVYDPTGTGTGAVADPFPNPLPPPPAGHSAQINPGCMGDGAVPTTGHNRISGQCGLWTTGFGVSVSGTVVPRHTVPSPASEDGRCQGPGPVSFPPGRFSGNSCPGNTVMFFDAIHHECTSAGGIHYIEVNRKVDDTPLAGTVAGQDFLLGPSCVWAWHGKWQDKNGNGVIDHRASFNVPQAGGNCNAPCDGRDTVTSHFPDEEFVWYGNCKKFPGVANPESLVSGYCALDTEAAAGGSTEMVGWLWPGNHHAYCGGALDPLFLTCFFIGADIPARQVIHFVGAAGFTATGGAAAVPCAPTAGNPNLGIFCELQFENFDETDELFTGDPLLGPQGGVRADQGFDDRTGDPALTTRQWVYGLGWAVYFYDSSILNSLVMVSGVGCQQGGPNDYLLETCRFADVDRFDTWNPTVEGLLSNTVKPLARSNWVVVRDGYIPLNKEIDGVTNNKLLAPNDVTGPLDDELQNPGFAREPNEAGDSFPAAQFNAENCALHSAADGDRAFNGWCNSYAAYAAGPRGYADMGIIRVIHENRPVVINTLTVLGVSGVFAATTLNPEAPAGSTLPVQRADGDHRRTLGAGKYLFTGVAGMWHDQAHTWTETVFLDLPALGIVSGTHTNGADGWVGSIVSNLGAWYYRGYADETCDPGTGSGSYPWAVCHPYRDGDVQNPQGYGIGEITDAVTGVTEWIGQCNGVSHGGNVAPPAGVPNTGVITLVPADGVWGPAPVLVWRDTLEGIRVTTTGGVNTAGLNIVDLTGTSGPIELKASCAVGARAGGINMGDMLILPLGNEDEEFTATLQVTVGTETIVDQDTFYAINLA